MTSFVGRVVSAFDTMTLTMAQPRWALVLVGWGALIVGGLVAALVLLFGLVASGQIKLRRIDGWRKIAAVLSQRSSMAA